jgi:3-hydroxyisobutyrate dehydrogenase-like beta-hydroxyacid dehydrogenase
MIRNTTNFISGPGSEPDAPESPAGATVGLIGLGLLGSAIADQLSENGYIVYGFDQKVRDVKNVILLSDSTEVFIKCDMVVFSLPGSRDVARVISEVDGVLEKDRHIVVDTTTGNPDEMERFHELLKKRGVDYIEANIAGSSEATRRGDAPLFLGGDKESIARLQPFFKAISKASFNIGAAGSASRFKLVHNLLLGLNRAVLAETLEFGKALGFDARKTLEIMKETPASSYVMVTKGERMVDSHFDSPQARLSQHLKDVRLILNAAKSSGAYVPLSQVHCRLLQELESDGFGELDNSAIITAFQRTQLKASKIPEIKKN